MSASEHQTVKLENDLVVSVTKPGDLVVCNLSSINLGRAVPSGVLERLIKIQVRMLDNTIDTNDLPVIQAQRTNSRYRGVGLGTFGWHHLLAVEDIKWESEEAVDYADKLYEDIAYHTIKASMEISKEKGSYSLFEGSEWDTGEYFDRKGYDDERWNQLRKDVNEYGIRNGYLMAVAPNASTSVICGSTASTDPVFAPVFRDEKKQSNLPVVAPDLNEKTIAHYKRSAYIVDQRWSVRQHLARQKHVDQAISFNYYVPPTIKVKVLLDLHMQMWDGGGKTSYYTRSSASDIAECEWCHS